MTHARSWEFRLLPYNTERDERTPRRQCYAPSKTFADQQGRLEALLNAGAPDAPYAVLVCHPHPLGGGTMHNKVVYHAMKAFQSFGLPVLRFNFRGTGLSEGEHDHGRRAGRRSRRPRLARQRISPADSLRRILLRVVCRTAASAAETPRVKGMVALGLPVHAEGRDYHYDFLSACAQPKLFISGTRDQYGPERKVEDGSCRRCTAEKDCLD